MESLAAGVPVIALASGAVPEIVDHGRTGFLIEPSYNAATDAQALANALGRLPELDRRTCRAVAEAHFALPRMLAAYAELYRKLALFKLMAPGSDIRPISPRLPTSLSAITDTPSLEALAPAWEQLWRADPNATPFQHPAWLLPWWRQFGPDGQLHALALHDAANNLCGLMPTYLYTPPSDETQVLLLGAGTSDYTDALFDPLYQAPGLAQQALAQVMQTDDCIYPGLSQLRPSSPLLTAGQALGWSPQPAEPTYTLPLACSLPAKIRANTGRYRRRAEALGPLTCTIAQTPAEALATFDQLAALHAQRWQTRHEPGVLADPRVLAHHREAIPRLLAASLLRLFRLTLAEHAIAVLYALADPPDRPNRSLYLYLIGIDPSRAELSPGTLLLHEVRQHARREGFTTLDFLRGGETYKHLWGAEPQPTFGLHAR